MGFYLGYDIENTKKKMPAFMAPMTLMSWYQITVWKLARVSVNSMQVIQTIHQ